MIRKIFETDSERFFLKEPDPELVREIQTKFDLTTLSSRILANRGLNTMEAIASFLSPSLKNLPDPFLFREMRISVERIYRAIKNRETILIYGDYDVDGITAASVLVNFFRTIHFPVDFYIPNRFRDGYGLNLSRLKQLHHDTPFSLLITVDCGSSNEEAIHEMARLGVDTIVTDHHLASARVSSAHGFVNPSLPACPFPFKELSGVGVAFFLTIALRSYLRDRNYWDEMQIPEPDLRRFLDIVCMGTISDMVPLKGVNRILVHAGLTILSRTDNLGLRQFLRSIGLYGKHPLSPWEIAFQIAPRFNAAGRLKNASRCVSLLTSDNLHEITSIVSELESLNSRRQTIEQDLLKIIENEIKQNRGYLTPFACVLWGDKWHEGVIGIAASKLIEKLGRPSALISFTRGRGKGSLRSIPGVDIFQALQQCQRWLDAFGGHTMAGGMQIKRKNLSYFCTSFSEAIRKQLKGEAPKKTWELDALLRAGTIPEAFFQELAQLEPFGIGNPPPLLAFQGIRIQSKRLLKEKHVKIRFYFDTPSYPLSGIAFNARDEWDRVERASGFIGTPGLNVWNGNTFPQVTIKRFFYH